MLKSGVKQTAGLCQIADDPQPTKNFPKQKDLSRTEQRCIRTAIKVNTTDTHLDLFIASWITTHLVCNSCMRTSVLIGTTNNQVPSIKVGHGRAQI